MGANVGEQWYREWVDRRRQVVQHFLQRRGEGVADAFPRRKVKNGKNVSDARRFVQLLVDPKILEDSPFTRISIVSLPKDVTLNKRNRKEVESELERHFVQLKGSQNIDATLIDQDEKTLNCLLKDIIKDDNIRSKLLRGNSYAHLLYKELRCAYLHEYRAGDRVGLIASDNTQSGALQSLAQYWIEPANNSTTQNTVRDARLLFDGGRLIDEWIPKIADNLAKQIQSGASSGKLADVALEPPTDYWLP